MSLTVLRLLFSLFSLLGFGFFLQKKQLVSAQFIDELGTLLLKVILPVSILSSTKIELTPAMKINFLIGLLIASGYYVAAFLIMIAISRKLQATEDRKKILISLCVFANTSFLGFPITRGLFGEEGFLYAVVYNLAFQLFFFSVGMVIVSGERKNIVKTVLTDVGTIVSLSAIAMVFLNIRIPQIIMTPMEMTGSMMPPLSMFIIGYKLARVPFKMLFQTGMLYLVSAFRLLIAPLLMFFILRLFPTPPILMAVMVLLSGLPSGALNVIIADRYHRDPEFAACAVSQSTFLMMITLPILIHFVM